MKPKIATHIPKLIQQTLSWFTSLSPTQKALLYSAFICAFFIIVVWIPVEIFFQQYCFNNYDLGIYAQAIHLLSLKNPNPWLSVRDIHLFNDHFDPILFTLLPIKGLVQPALLGIRTEMTVALLGLIPLLVIVRKELLSITSFLFVATFSLFTPVVLDAYFYPIHPGTWSLLPLSLTLMFLLLNKWPWALFTFAFVLLCKEEFPIVGIAIASALFLQKKYKASFGFAAVSIAWGILVFVLRPHILGPSGQYTGAVSGASGLALITNPKSLISIGERLLCFFLPLFFVPLVFPPVSRISQEQRKQFKQQLWFILPAAATLAALLCVRLLGGWWFSHRSAPLAIALIYCVIPLLHPSLPQPKHKAWQFAFVLLFAVALPNIQMGFRAYTGRTFQSHCPANPIRIQQLNFAKDIFLKLPAGSSLIEGNIIPAVVERPNIAHAGASALPLEKIRYLFLEKNSAGDQWPLTTEGLNQLVSQWRKNSNTKTLIDNDSVLILEKTK